MASPGWKGLVAKKKEQQAATVPKEWIIKELPSNDTLNVVGFPECCGLLTPKEIQITTSETSPLLANIANATWSAVEVATAFAKRAVIAHQLVSPSRHNLAIYGTRMLKFR